MRFLCLHSSFFVSLMSFLTYRLSSKLYVVDLHHTFICYVVSELGVVQINRLSSKNVVVRIMSFLVYNIFPGKFKNLYLRSLTFFFPSLICYYALSHISIMPLFSITSLLLSLNSTELFSHAPFGWSQVAALILYLKRYVADSRFL